MIQKPCGLWVATFKLEQNWKLRKNVIKQKHCNITPYPKGGSRIIFALYKVHNNLGDKSWAFKYCVSQVATLCIEDQIKSKLTMMAPNYTIVSSVFP
jgi:hypothetical protein